MLHLVKPLDLSQHSNIATPSDPEPQLQESCVYDSVPLDTEEQVKKYIGGPWTLTPQKVVSLPRLSAKALGIHKENQLITFPMEHFENHWVKGFDWLGRLCILRTIGRDTEKVTLYVYRFDPSGDWPYSAFYYYPEINKSERGEQLLILEWGKWLCNHVGLDNLHKMQIIPDIKNKTLFEHLKEYSAGKGFEIDISYNVSYPVYSPFVAVKIQHFDDEGNELFKCIELIRKKTYNPSWVRIYTSPSLSSDEKKDDIPYYSKTISLEDGEIEYPTIFKTDDDFKLLKDLLNGEKIKTSQMESGYVRILKRSDIPLEFSNIYDDEDLDAVEELEIFMPRGSIFKPETVSKWPRVSARSLGIHKKNQQITFPMEYFGKTGVKSMNLRGRLCLITAEGKNKNRIPLRIHTFDRSKKHISSLCYYYPGENGKALLTKEWGEWLCNYVGIDTLHRLPIVIPQIKKINDQTTKNEHLHDYFKDHSIGIGTDQEGCRFIAMKMQHFDNDGNELFKSIELVHENGVKDHSKRTFVSTSINLENSEIKPGIFKTDQDFSLLKNLLNDKMITTSQTGSGSVKILD